MSYRTKIVAFGVGVILVNSLVFIALLSWPTSPRAPHEGEQKSTERDTRSVEGASAPVAHSSSVTSRDHAIREGTKTVPAEVDSVLVPVYTACSVLDAMREEERAGNLTFAGKEYPGLGLFVEEIQGVRPPDGKYWILYINGSPASRGVAEAMVTPKDLVEWKLEESIY